MLSVLDQSSINNPALTYRHDGERGTAMKGVILRVKRVKFLFENGQITNVDATRLLEQKIHNLSVTNYVFNYTILNHGGKL